jgi:2-dehydro-3-deoxyphosphogluconate aldolase / (4S)-4-hydroxy-2-oxoglutarate aldolase
MVSDEQLREALREARLLAIARGGAPERVSAALGVLAEAGVRLAEVSLSHEGGLGALAAAASEVGDRLLLGAGTVLSAADVEAAAAAGARFIVTPAGVDEVTRACADRGLPLLPGAFTATEVAAAVRSGAAAVKLFPAEPAGPAHLAALRGPFPRVPFVPVGGIGPDEARAYLAAGALAVGVGSPLFGDALGGGDLGALRERARTLLEAVGP